MTIEMKYYSATYGDELLDAVPLDVPEGSSVVCVSVTLFYQWVDQHGLRITEWGEPVERDGVKVYSPMVEKADEHDD